MPVNLQVVILDPLLHHSIDTFNVVIPPPPQCWSRYAYDPRATTKQQYIHIDFHRYICFLLVEQRYARIYWLPVYKRLVYAHFMMTGFNLTWHLFWFVFLPWSSHSWFNQDWSECTLVILLSHSQQWHLVNTCKIVKPNFWTIKV